MVFRIFFILVLRTKVGSALKGLNSGAARHSLTLLSSAPKSLMPIAPWSFPHTLYPHHTLPWWLCANTCCTQTPILHFTSYTLHHNAPCNLNDPMPNPPPHPTSQCTLTLNDTMPNPPLHPTSQCTLTLNSPMPTPSLQPTSQYTLTLNSPMPNPPKQPTLQCTLPL